jgi:hypothetical protein
LAAGTTLLLSISVSGLATGLGAVYPKFGHDNLASVSVSAGAMVFMVLAFGLVIMTVSLESWIYYLLASGQTMPHRFPVSLHLAVCLVGIFIINGAAFYLPMKAGAGKLLKGHFLF